MTSPDCAVIFDLDGTLVDSEPFWDKGYSVGLAQSLHKRGLGDGTPLTLEKGKYAGGRVTDTVARILTDLGVMPRLDPEEFSTIAHEVIAFVTHEFREHPQQIDEAVETAKGLHKERWPMAIASSSAESFIDAAVEKLGLQEVFSIQVSALELKEGKPNPEVYHITAGELDVPAERIVAVEDSPVGVLAALEAGMTCVWFQRPVINPDPEAAPPDPHVLQQIRTIKTEAPQRLVETDHLTTELVQRVLERISTEGAADRS